MALSNNINNGINSYNGINSASGISYLDEENKPKKVYNAMVARQSLSKFATTYKAALTEINDAFTELMSDLQQHWGSPKGAEFGRNHSNFKDVITNALADGNAIISSAVADINSYAQSATDGKTGFSFNERIAVPTGGYATINESFPDGGIGVRGAKIVDDKDKFKAAVGSALSKIQSLASCIEACDANNNVKQILNGKVQAAKSYIINEINTRTKAIDEEIENHRMAVKAAKSAASEKFRSASKNRMSGSITRRA